VVAVVLESLAPPNDMADGQMAATAWLGATVLVTVGALVGAAMLAPQGSATPVRGFALLLFLGSSVHVASTGWLYTLPDVRAYAVRRPVRYIWAPIALIAVAGVLGAVTSPSDFAWLLPPFFAWQFLHFQKQNLGVAALAASSRRIASLNRFERWTLMVTGGAGIVGLLSRPGLLRLKVDLGIRMVFPAAELVFAGAVVTGVILLAQRTPRDRPTPFCVVYLVSLLFSLPVFLFTSPYAAVGGMTIAHGLQYLLMVGLVAVGSKRGAARRVRLVALCNVALVGGAVLSIASHLHGAAPVGRFLFGAYLGVVMAHFVVDAGLWRLRDPFPRALLAEHAPYLLGVGEDQVMASDTDTSLTGVQ
jgi:hypothetical protein